MEELYYSIYYTEFIYGQNERNIKNRHSERNRTTSDILKHKKTSPEETIYQIGTLDNHTSPDILLQVVTDFMTEITKRFGTHVHILNWALHLENKEALKQREIYESDERNRMIGLKCWSYAGYAMFILLYIALLFAGAINVVVMNTILVTLAGFAICLLISRLILNKIM